MKFKELGLEDALLRNIGKMGYEVTTPIQEQTLPIIKSGKDLLGLAQTGSGKTAAYALPIINRRMNEEFDEKQIRTLVVSPTRELAIQIRDNFLQFCGNNIDLKVQVVVGGVNINEQSRKLRKGCDILIATPGRLSDLLKQRRINISNVDVLVLDEADTMLDMGFISDIKLFASRVNGNHQTIMFSATMPKEINELTNEFMNDPERVEIVSREEDKPQIDEKVYFIRKEDKNDCLLDIISSKRIEQALIFTKTKIGADKLERFMKSYDLSVAVIHGDKRQGCRLRSLKDFKSGKAKYLIATDIAARGIDVSGLPFVINYNMPEQAEVYVHRIGRTGRAGEKGEAISIVSTDEIGLLKDVQRLTKKDLEVVKDEKYVIEVDLTSRDNTNSSSRRSRSTNRSNSSRGNGGNRRRSDKPSNGFSSDYARDINKDNRKKKFSDDSKKDEFGNYKKRDRFSDSKKKRNNGDNRNNRFNDSNNSSSRNKRNNSSKRYDRRPSK